jgi:hypothetical protein
VLDTLNKAANAVLAEPRRIPAWRLGAVLLPGLADGFGKLMADETDK